MRKDDKKNPTAERRGWPRWACRTAFFVCSWAAFWGLARWACAYTLCARSQMWAWLGDADPQGLWGMGGLARAAGLWMGSLLTSPASASALLATLSALASLFTLLIMSRISKGAGWVAPLALCPGAAMTLMLCDVYAPLSAPLALTLALGCVCACLLPKQWWMSATLAVVLAPAVIYFAGPWLVPGATYAPWINTEAGGRMTQAYIWGLGLPLAAAVVGRFLHPKANKVRIFWSATSCAVLAIFLFRFSDAVRKPSDEALCELSYYASRGEWAKIESRCRQLPMADEPLLQNCWSLAMAEQGKLADRLFAQPWVSPYSIIDLNQRSPMAYMLFSDIFWSMGQIGLAQRYAFEANEALGNASPRMLRRLVDTNLAFGQQAVADKYLRLLGNDYAPNSAIIEAKSRCIPAENSFAFNPTLKPDLLATLRANPEHKATMQYLGCMCLLSKDVPGFAEVITEFYGTPALPAPLPQHFQEGVAMASLAAGNDLAERCAIEPSLMQACRAFWSRQQQYDESYWHYIRDYSPVDQ